MTLCNSWLSSFIFYKCRRSVELQKSTNETLYVSSQISPTIFPEAVCPIYSNFWCPMSNYKINWTPKIYKWNFACVFPNFTNNISWSQVSYILQCTFWVAINTIWWSDFQFPMSNFCGISLLLTCSKMTHTSISSPHLFLFFFNKLTPSNLA